MIECVLRGVQVLWLVPLLFAACAWPARADDERERFVSANICETTQRLKALANAPQKRKSAPDWQGRYLIVGRKNKPEAFSQCIMSPSERAIRCEAASGRFLKDAAREAQLFGPDGRTRIETIGFAPPEGVGNYWLTRTLGTEPKDIEAIARLMLSAVFDGYGPLVEPRPSYVSPMIEPFVPSCSPVS